MEQPPPRETTSLSATVRTEDQQSVTPAKPITISEMTTAVPKSAWLTVAQRLAYALIGLLLFVLALELLKCGAAGYGKLLVEQLNITSLASVLGFGWLLAYIFLSGSPVAAIAVAFFASGTIDGLQTFTMITGSRLGASFIVLFVGFLYHLRGHRRAASVAIGVLAFLTTASIYLPALVLGYWLLQSQLIGVITATVNSPLNSVIDIIVDPIVAFIVHISPDWSLLIIGALILLSAFSLLDRAIPMYLAGKACLVR